MKIQIAHGSNISKGYPKLRPACLLTDHRRLHRTHTILITVWHIRRLRQGLNQGCLPWLTMCYPTKVLSFISVMHFFLVDEADFVHVVPLILAAAASNYVIWTPPNPPAPKNRHVRLTPAESVFRTIVRTANFSSKVCVFLL